MRALSIAALALLAGPLAAQDSPRASNPERPTVATHAYTVAAGYVELETGVKVFGELILNDAAAWEFNLKLGLAKQLQLGFFGTAYGRNDVGSGVGDLGLTLKWTRPLAGPHTVALVPGVSFPVGDETLGLGAGRVLGSLTAVYSVDLPAELHFDANTGPAGIGPGRPQWFTSIGLAREFGRVAIATELFDFTAGAVGAPQRGFLASLLVTATQSIVVDVGGVVGLAASPDQFFVGATMNFGRLF